MSHLPVLLLLWSLATVSLVNAVYYGMRLKSQPTCMNFFLWLVPMLMLLAAVRQGAVLTMPWLGEAISMRLHAATLGIANGCAVIQLLWAIRGEV